MLKVDEIKFVEICGETMEILIILSLTSELTVEFKFSEFLVHFPFVSCFVLFLK